MSKRTPKRKLTAAAPNKFGKYVPIPTGFTTGVTINVSMNMLRFVQKMANDPVFRAKVEKLM